MQKPEGQTEGQPGEDFRIMAPDIVGTGVVLYPLGQARYPPFEVVVEALAAGIRGAHAVVGLFVHEPGENILPSFD